LQDGDVISVAVRRFKFEYAQDSGEGSGLEAPWLPDSPAPTRSYGGQANFGEEDQAPGSPMRPSKRATGSTRFAASSRRRNSTRLHLFPEHAASKEVKDAILALAGNETPSTEDEAAGKKRDLAYMEMVDEDEEQGTGVGIEAKILEAANSPVKVCCRFAVSSVYDRCPSSRCDANRISLSPTCSLNAPCLGRLLPLSRARRF
jgi:hypothetical protein